MLKNKGVKPTYKQAVVEPKVSNPSIHMVDENMAITKSKVIEEQLFKDRKPIKKKSIADWEKEQKLQQSFVKTIQEIQVEDPPQNLIPKEKAQWNTSWAGLPEFEVSIEPIVSQNLFANPINKVMSMEQIFQDISRKNARDYLYFEVRSIVEYNTKSLKIYVVETKARKT